MKARLSNCDKTRNKTKPRNPSYIFKRGDYYYFRHIIPAQYKERFGNEICLSLRTALRGEALKLSQYLHLDLLELLEIPGMQIDELKRRLNDNLKNKLEEDSANLAPRRPSTLFPGIEIEHPEFTYSDTCLHIADLLLKDTQDPEILLKESDEILQNLVKTGIISSQQVELASNYDKQFVTKLYYESEIIYHQILAKRSQGDYSFEKNFNLKEISKNNNEDDERFGKSVIDRLLGLTPEEIDRITKIVENKGSMYANYHISQSASDETVSTSISKPQKSMLLSTLRDKYIESKIKGKRWKTHTVSGHKSDINVFVRVVGDNPIHSITRDMCNNFRDKLQSLPANYSRATEYKDKSIDDIIMIEHNKPKIERKKPLSIKRVNYLISEITNMFNWAKSENILKPNPAINLMIKDNSKEIDDKKPFDTRDLELIFSHPKFSQGKFKYPAYFWVPLIGLFTGMRLEEISQLYTKDIYQKDNIWIIDINEKGVDSEGFEKTLKNKNATRLVPVHNTLVELGFIDFWKHISDRNCVRLFPELTKTEKSAKFGKQPGKQFSAVIKNALSKANCSYEHKSFHSLRHTFDNFFKQNQLIDDVFLQLFGHDNPWLAKKRYGAEFPPEKLNQLIQKLDYGVDFSHLKYSRYVHPELKK